MRLFTCLCLLILISPTYAAKVSIVIDDIGYRQTDSIALTLPGKVTFSVLPHTPFGKSLANKISHLNKDVMLHIPMEAMNGKFMGPGGLSSSMNQGQFNAELYNALRDIPQAIGINNHMGSKLTTLSQQMLWTMAFLKRNNLFFLDSKTSQHSVAAKTAKTLGVPTLSRHIFLDNNLSEEYITKQFNQMMRHALKHKRTIAIAHPHPKSVEVLSKLIPTLAENGIELVSISSLINKSEQHHLAAGNTD